MKRKRVDLTDEQVAFIKANYHTMSNATMAKKFDINFITFCTKLHAMGLYRMRMEYWTDEQIYFLKTNYKKIGDKELAILFNMLWVKEKTWTWKHIEKKRLYLNLKRTTAQIKKIKARNTARGCWLNTSTWKTRNAAPVGEVRIWKGGWRNRNGFTTGQFKVIKQENGFVHYAHWLYEQTYGPMPENHVVGFKDRNNMNVVPENLEAITRREQARRNSVTRGYPEDLKEIIEVLKQLNKTIKIKQDERK